MKPENKKKAEQATERRPVPEPRPLPKTLPTPETLPEPIADPIPEPIIASGDSFNNIQSIESINTRTEM